MSTTILSLGAGVQSTTLLLMAEQGEVERPTAAVFADTQAEPLDVYRHLDWLESATTIPITRVTAGSLEQAVLTKDFAPIPLYVRDEKGKKSMLRRQCTREYKVAPIRRHIRATYPKQKITLLMGISYDEALRMRDSGVKYITHSYPLVDLQMTRADCLAWLEQHGYPRPPKSACYFCPFMDNQRWRDMAAKQPAEFARAVAFDEAVRTLPRISGEAFVHRQAIPLTEVDMSTPEEKGQLAFLDECEGMCGV